MLPKNAREKLVTDFRPIANIHLFCKVLAYMILAQHGFRSGQGMEEHVFVQSWWIAIVDITVGSKK